MALTQHQYKALLGLHERLVRVGWHPAIAGKLVLRAAARVLRAGDAGMGKVWQRRRVHRELPGVPPRPVVGGERCRHIQEVPGQEERLYEEINRLQQQGWNVMEVEASRGHPRLKTFYACPPGATPLEAQPRILEAEPWGPPLYMEG